MTEPSEITVHETPEISLSAHHILDVGSFSLTNTVLASLIVSLLITAIAVFFRTKVRLIPGRFQVFMELLVGFFLEQLEAAWGSEERARKVLPLVLTLFLFLLIGNQFVFLPLVASVMKGGVEVFRTPSTDLSLTLTFAITMVLGAHIIAMFVHPLQHPMHYLKINSLIGIRKIKDIPNALLEMFLGVLEVIGDIAKMMSLSCRLFGNIFAGEVVITMVTFLVAYIVPMPFILIAFFGGIIQAFVFCLLSLNFMAAIARSSEAHGHGH